MSDQVEIVVLTGNDYSLFLGHCSPCMKYGNMGLRYPLKHLEAITNKIPFYPIEEQARYADEVCRHNVDNPEMLLSLHPGNLVPLARWNTTSVGNLAYIALNTRYKKVGLYARALLDLFKKAKNGTL